MSKHNRERRLLWKLGIHKKQVWRKLGNPKHVSQKWLRIMGLNASSYCSRLKVGHDEIREAKAKRLAA